MFLYIRLSLCLVSCEVKALKRARIETRLSRTWPGYVQLCISRICAACSAAAGSSDSSVNAVAEGSSLSVCTPACTYPTQCSCPRRYRSACWWNGVRHLTFTLDQLCFAVLGQTPRWWGCRYQVSISRRSPRFDVEDQGHHQGQVRRYQTCQPCPYPQKFLLEPLRLRPKLSKGL